MSAHRFLLLHLFRRGNHLQVLLKDNSVAGQQRRLAIYQLLQFTFSFRATPGIDPKRAFLEHLRRLEILDEDKQLRQLPAAASEIDAVRMMTVHASKGLQFRSVHIPSVTSRHFPVNRTDRDTPPKGLIDTDSLMSREAEEESLFFVAMSRAQDELHFSRAVSYGGGAWSHVKPSPFLDRIRAHLPKRPDASPSWTDEGAVEPAGPTLQPPESSETGRPAQSRLISNARAVSITPKFCRYWAAVRLRRRTYGSNRRCTPVLPGYARHHRPRKGRRVRRARLAENWEKSGPRGRAFETIYRAAAEQMLATALRLMDGTSLPAEVSLTLAGGVVVNCRADHVSSGTDGIMVRRLKTSRLSEREGQKARYVIMQAALRQTESGHPGRLRARVAAHGRTTACND